ncbi:DNA helicase [Halobacteriovorax vibrionivorans]|uniref:DNA helicase n=1 Tax=Halobacteriovorax vibrionivorans TaxID=2152716 RepID=A0ABY0IIC5_9BACT|nr:MULTISPECIES: DNA helicase [Halobacteriovorax]RZF22305.1 DNA helicase [Halobacteriovorax vibrionivorans]TGD48557.1 DNA helicase [Halobacteriovorax sp. Y22]
MKLSSPIFVLKSHAKKLKKNQGITMSEALDLVARAEGFSSWSLLKSKSQEVLPQEYSDILGYLNDGDLVLIGSRPGMGKTSFALGLFVQAINANHAKSFCFTLAHTHKEYAARIGTYDQTIGHNNERFELNYSDDISADYIIKATKNEVAPGSLIIVDYLQLLDEKRINPPLQTQVEKLKTFAKESGCIIIFISQIVRDVEDRIDKHPTVDDIRLPNPLDLNLMNKIILLYREKRDSKIVDVTFAGKTDHRFQVGWDGSEVRFFDL